MTQRTYPYPVNKETISGNQQASDNHIDQMAARRLSDKVSLLRPLQDEHLLEVYREAKKMNLSTEFIELLEEAIAIRQIVKHQQS